MAQLSGVKAEHVEIAVLGNGLAADVDPEGVGGIVDQLQVMAAGDISQGSQIAGVPKDMDSQDRSSPGGDGRFHFFGNKGIMFGFDITEDQPDIVPVKSMGSGHKAERRGNYLSRSSVATTDR